jgi:D-glycero-D-manno-heptose 1,7-bisphosphate phosphatase
MGQSLELNPSSRKGDWGHARRGGLGFAAMRATNVRPGTTQAVFLDRDGVLNRALVRSGRPYSPSALADFEILPGAPDACRRLRRAGFILVVVSNQPDISRGTLSAGLVDVFHAELRRQVEVDDVRVCPHDDTDACSCRKPAPGLLLEAAEVHGIDLATSFMVGDRWRDIAAGQRAGCQTVLIDHRWAERPAYRPDAVATDVVGAADWIIRTSRREEIA